MRTICFYFSIIIFMQLICLYIEHLNIKAGSILPRKEYRNNDPSQGMIKWRSSAITDEKSWRKAFGPEDESGVPVKRNLYEQELTEMKRYIDRIKSNNKLRDFISSFGLMQYCLVPIAALWSIYIIFSKRHKRKMKIAATVSLIIALGCGYMAHYRSYFGSLGW